MNVAEILTSLATRGPDLARAAAEGDPVMLATSWGLPATTVRRWARAAANLTGNPRISVDALVIVDAAVRKLHPDAAITKDELRSELHAYAETTSCDLLKAHANDRVRHLNAPVNNLDTMRQRRYLRISAAPDADGMRHATLCLPDSDMARLTTQLSDAAKRLRAASPTLTQQQAMADALLQQQPRAEKSEWLQPAILLTAADLEHRGDGWLATTDGALIRAEDYVKQRIAPYGLVLLYDGKAEPVDLWRTQRFANDKQRAIINLDQLLCADPTCHHAAATGEVHHIRAWSRGGNTNLDNLVGSCSLHNRRNDDNPNRRKYGRLSHHPVTKEAGRQSPSVDAAFRVNTHPVVRYSGRRRANEEIRKARSHSGTGRGL